uniref:DUF3615 domain-containing protein n=1 Tax=Oryza glaberrima TaxID=4538 RepID=I1QVQ9_ORYGL
QTTAYGGRGGVANSSFCKSIFKSELEIKYELVRTITSCGNLDEGFHGHVNFIAKGDCKNSEELFFAEVRWENNGYIPTCMVSLEGKEKIGGYYGARVHYPRGVPGLPIDKQHCYFCGDELKHPEDGTLYESGHAASSDYYE